MGKFAVALSGLASGVALLLWSPTQASITYLASSVAFIVAVFWGLQGCLLSRNILITRRAKEENEAAQTPAESTPLPPTPETDAACEAEAEA